MAHYLSGSKFAVKAIVRVGIFAALTLGFPFIVYGILVVTNARAVGGASGALAVVAGLLLKPVIILGFLLSLIGPCWRRMQSLGLPGYAGLMPALLMLMDGPFLLLIGAHWGVGFTLGVMRLDAPIWALTGLSMLIAMSLANEERQDGGDGGVPWGPIGTITVLLLIAFTIVALPSGIWRSLPVLFSTGIASLLAESERVTLLVKPYLCIAINGAMLWLVWQSRRGGTNGAPPSRPVHTPSPPLSSHRTVFGLRK